MKRHSSTLRLRTVGLALGLGVGLLLWIAGPFAVLAVVMEADLSDELVAESRGGAAEVVGVAMAWEAPVQLFAPAWDGVVQRVHVAPGAEVANGAQLVTVNGLTRLLAASGVSRSGGRWAWTPKTTTPVPPIR